MTLLFLIGAAFIAIRILMLFGESAKQNELHDHIHSFHANLKRGESREGDLCTRHPASIGSNS